MNTSEDAHETAIELLSTAVSAAVLHALTEDGMRSLEPKVYVRPVDELDGDFPVDVHYGSRRQYLIRGRASVDRITMATWGLSTVTLIGAEHWRITIVRQDGQETVWSIRNLQQE